MKFFEVIVKKDTRKYKIKISMESIYQIEIFIFFTLVQFIIYLLLNGYWKVTIRYEYLYSFLQFVFLITILYSN